MSERISLAAVAAMIPCHPRTLRVRLADPCLAGSAPKPLPRPSDQHPYRFEREGVLRWLEVRAARREILRKPYLRWLAHSDEAPRQKAAA